MSELLAGTVTVLVADVEGSARLWRTQPDAMAAAVARLDRRLSDVIAAHEGVWRVEQGEGDGVTVAFARASDAVACALALQRAPLGSTGLRVGVHTGELAPGDEGNCLGAIISRATRVRDLAHDGQTLLSAVTEALVVERLPTDAWLTDLGTYSFGGVPRLKRVMQLCHPDLRNEFPPLHTLNSPALQHLPVQLTTFIGRAAQINEVRGILADNRLVTLIGAGGVGKTRLGVQIATQMAGQFSGGVWYVDLAPINDPDLVPVAAARALGLPDQPGRSTMDTLIRSIHERHLLVVVDNCEHLLDATAALTVDLLGACPKLTCLATSRAPISVDGEVIWRVPSLSLTDEAIELFTDRARRPRPDFCIGDDNRATVEEICRRLDGIPLAIELAAARVRTLSLDELLNGLQDCFRLLTGGSRRASRRQQTLRASVDWSHALLTDPERVVFRRLSVFVGGFDLDTAQIVTSGSHIKAHQVLDELTLLVDKSLVVAEDMTGQTRYRLLETIRQYALEKLAESGEVDAVHTRHRDHYTALAGLLDSPAQTDYERRIDRAVSAFDNLRAAYTWSRANGDAGLALQLASSLQPVWLGRGRIREGFEWFDAILAAGTKQNQEVAPAVRARALADQAELHASMGGTESTHDAQEALALARDVDDPALLARVLTACGAINGSNVEAAQRYFAEAIELAREVGDPRRLSHVLARQAYAAAFIAGDPVAVRTSAEEGLDLANAVGDRLWARACRWCLGLARSMHGDLAGAAAQFREVADEAEAAHDLIRMSMAQYGLAIALARNGDTSGAQAAAAASIQAAAELGDWRMGHGYMALSIAALAAGDVVGAEDAVAAGWHRIQSMRYATNFTSHMAETAFARGDYVAARRWADEAASAAAGWHLSKALTTRARVAIATGTLEEAERDAHDALACSAKVEAYRGTPDTLECVAQLASQAGSCREAARLFGAAQAIRQRNGEVRFQVYQADYQASVAALRNAMGEQDFEHAWVQGAALSTREAIAYAAARPW